MRPLDITRDLGEVADLMALAFGDNLDPVARSALREMRRLQAPTMSAWFLRQLYWWSQSFPPGFVWIADGRVVGNVSVRPADTAGGWIIGNVAVSPAYRRRGIARALMDAARGLVEMRRGQWIALQVEDGNENAQRLYRKLGFWPVGTVTRWHRETRPGDETSWPADPANRVRARRGGEWWREYELAHAVQGQALAWIEPAHAEEFRPSTAAALARWLEGRAERHGLAVVDGALVGAVRVQAPGLLSKAGARDAHIELFVHPDWRGQVEMPLLAYGLRRLPRTGKRGPLEVRVDYPAGEPAAEEALRACGFAPVRALVTMRLDIK